MIRTDASKHQADINRAISAKRPFTLIGYTGKKFIALKLRGVPNFMPHMEAIVRAAKESRDFFVYADFAQRYFSSSEFKLLCDEGEE